MAGTAVSAVGILREEAADCREGIPPGTAWTAPRRTPTIRGGGRRSASAPTAAAPAPRRSRQARPPITRSLPPTWCCWWCAGDRSTTGACETSRPRLWSGASFLHTARRVSGRSGTHARVSPRCSSSGSGPGAAARPAAESVDMGMHRAELGSTGRDACGDATTAWATAAPTRLPMSQPGRPKGLPTTVGSPGRRSRTTPLRRWLGSAMPWGPAPTAGRPCPHRCRWRSPDHHPQAGTRWPPARSCA